jgi:4-carboxymuconolactone decarboxylase
MSRIKELSPADMTQEQRELYDSTRASGGLVGGPNIAYLRIPKFMRINQATVAYLRSNSLAPRLRQLAVLRTVKYWGAKFAWALHASGSVKVGIEQDIIDDIGRGQEPASASPKDRAVLRVCAELLEDRKLSDEAYKTAIDMFGETGLADIVATAGFYSLTSLTLNAFDIDPPAE